MYKLLCSYSDNDPFFCNTWFGNVKQLLYETEYKFLRLYQVSLLDTDTSPKC